MNGRSLALTGSRAVLRRRGSLDEITEADWDFQHDINLKAAFFLCRAAGNAMIEQGQGGRIITFSSQGWWTGGFGGSVVYNATKGAVVTMTRGLARNLAPHGIRVNAIAPGMVDTAMLRDGLTDEALADVVAATPMRRLGAPAEMAGAAIFLCSDQATFITGAVINVSGGFLMY